MLRETPIRGGGHEGALAGPPPAAGGPRGGGPRIAEALDAAERGEGQLLLLRGEAGCGKTRLVQEAAAPDDFQSDWREGRGRQGAGCVGGT